MSHDIFQQVPQGSLRAQDAENRRVGAIADELRRLCQLYEAQCGDSQPHVSHLEVEHRAAETFSKEHGLWLPIENVFDLGVPGPSGNENDTYVTDDSIYKVMHNIIFPETYYRLHAFTGFDGRTVMPVLRQRRIANSEPTPQIAIDTYMAALGFDRQEQTGRYTNETFTVWDLIPRNVLRDYDGDIFVVDAEIKRNE